MMNKQIINKVVFKVVTILFSASCNFAYADVASSTQQDTEKVGPKQEIEQDRLFPIWGKEARERGYTLPKTYGLSLSYMSMDQPININSIDLSGPLSVAPNQDLNAISDVLFDRYLDISDATQQANNITLRADMWVFPFLNVYGLLGYTEGTSSAPITCKAGRPTSHPIKNPLAPIINAVCGADANETRRVGTFNLDYQGLTYGVGTTLAGGVGNWFTILDINFSRTELDILDGQINSVVISPRVGYRFSPYNHELRVWVGGMYQGIQQKMAGNLSDILSGELASKVNAISPDGRFDVRQELESEWNTTLGFNYVLNSSWDVVGEVGMGERTSAFIGLGYRF